MSSLLKLLLIVTIVGASKGNDNLVCLEGEEELIRTTPIEEKENDLLLRRKVTFLKLKTRPNMPIKSIRTERKTQYCPASLNLITDETCKTETRFIGLDSGTLKIAFERKQCPIGKVCNGESCDGLSKSECEDQTLLSWLDPGKSTPWDPSSSFLFHRCTKAFSCNIVDIKVFFYFIDGETIQAEGEPFKKCRFRWNDTRCDSENGWVLEIPQAFKVDREIIELPCLRGKENEICWDKDESNEFIFQGEETTVDNLYYKSLSIKMYSPKKEPIFKEGSLAFSKDIEFVYRTLQYENLQTSYDLLILKKEIKSIEKVLSSLLHHMYGITEDALEKHRGMPGKIKQWNSTHITLLGCRRINEKKVSAIMESDVIRRSKMFDDSKLVLEEFRNRDFRITDFDYSSLKHIRDSNAKRVLPGIPSVSGFSIMGSLVSPIINFLTFIEKWVFWAASCLCFVIAKKLFVLRT